MLPRQYAELAKAIERALHDAGVDTSALEARRIMEHRAGIGWPDVIAKPTHQVDEAVLALIANDIARRIAGEPLSRIYGVREFWGLEFELSPDTLDPRPDTELVIELALKNAVAPPARILDLGTGTGCILIALLHEFKTAYGVGLDRSFGAIETARQNAVKNGVEPDRVSFICGDWVESLAGSFDLIVSNPPYISNPDIANLGIAVKKHDPILALDGGKDGLQAYRILFSSLKTLLSPCGQAYFEIGYDQEKNAVRLAEESGLQVVGVHRDLAGQPRVVEISGGDK